MLIIEILGNQGMSKVISRLLYLEEISEYFSSTLVPSEVNIVL